MAKGIHRNSLTEAQLEILTILYKFRFLNVDLVRGYMGLKTKTHSLNRLKSLVEHEYIGRKYSGKYKIHGKPAIYYLLPRGIALLKADPQFAIKALNGMYKDGQRTEDFMSRCLQIFKIYLSLDKLYGDKLSYFSKNELIELDYFPKHLPDAYIELQVGRAETRQYFMEFIDQKLTYSAIRDKINGYIRHFNSGEWYETQSNYPTILFIAETTSLERTVQRLAKRLLVKADIDEMKMCTATLLNHWSEFDVLDVDDAVASWK